MQSTFGMQKATTTSSTAAPSTGFAFNTSLANTSSATGLTFGMTGTAGATAFNNPATAGSTTTTATGFSLPGTTTTTSGFNFDQQSTMFASNFGSNLFSTTTTAPTLGTSTGSTGFTLGAPATSATTGFTLGMPASTSTTGFSLGAPATTSSTGFTLGAPTTTTATGFSFGSNTSTASTGFSFGTSTSTAATGFSLGAPTTTAATGFNFSTSTTTGFSLTKPTTQTLSFSTATTASSSTTSSASLTAPAATSTTTSLAVTSSPSVKPTAPVKFAQLEENINKWTIELEEQEKVFMNQVAHINEWDRLLLSNGDKIVALNNSVEKVKLEQQQLDHELDFIVAQQRELEECLLPLEREFADVVSDPKRDATYKLAENLNTQLRHMSEDLKEIIEDINEKNKNQDITDPIVQIGRILNAHMNSLQWVDQNTTLIKQQLDQVTKLTEIHRRENDSTQNL